MRKFEFQVVRTEWHRAVVEVEAPDRETAEAQVNERIDEGGLTYELETSALDLALLSEDGVDV